MDEPPPHLAVPCPLQTPAFYFREVESNSRRTLWLRVAVFVTKQKLCSHFINWCPVLWMPMERAVTPTSPSPV